MLQKLLYILFLRALCMNAILINLHSVKSIRYNMMQEQLHEEEIDLNVLFGRTEHMRIEEEKLFEKFYEHQMAKGIKILRLFKEKPWAIKKTDFDQFTRNRPWCFCNKPNDGRKYILCSDDICTIRWFHTECMELDEIPYKWYCPLCVSEYI